MIPFAAGTLAVTAFLAWATFQSAALLRRYSIPSNLLLLPSENLLRLFLLAICVGLGWVSGLPASTFGWSLSDPWRDTGLGLGVGVVVAAILPPLTRWAVRTFGAKVYSPLVIRSILPRSRREWLLIPFALASAVALEELLFRSLLLGGFGALVPAGLLAVLWSALFGLLHVPQGSLGVLAAAVLSLILSALFLETHSLLTPLVAHYAIDLLQVVRACFDPSYRELLEETS